MALELIVTKEDLRSSDYTVREKLLGPRFRLGDELQRYAGQSDPESIFEIIHSFFLTQYVTAPRIEERLRIDSPTAMAVASYLASHHAASKLETKVSGSCSYFENKKIDFRRMFSEVSSDMLLLYLTALKECGPTEHLEVITDSFLAWCLGLAKKELEPAEERDKIQRGKFFIAEQGYVVNLQEKLQNRSTLDLTKYTCAPLTAKQEVKQEVKHEANEPERLSPGKSEVYIYGQEHVKQEFAKIAAIVRNREHLSRLFDAKKLFQHYLLVGPPGSGKTALVRSLASQCGMAFLHIPCVELGSEFFSKTSRNIHEVYRGAEKLLAEYPGTFIFFDEFDHLAKRRGYAHSAEADTCITALNENLDGGSRRAGIITIGATNVEEMIDPAIRNRMKKLYVGYPETDEGIIGIHQAVIRKMEHFAHRKLFEEMEYKKILDFSKKDPRYRSGRVVDAILYETALRIVLDNLNSSRLVSTADVMETYLHYELNDVEAPGFSLAGEKVITR